MKVEDVTRYLEKRLEEAESWAAAGFPGELRGLKLRDYACSATALTLLNDAGRKEAKGVQFRLTWEGPSGRAYTDVEVRFVPEGSFSRSGDGSRTYDPYFAIYVSGVPGVLTYQSFKEGNLIEEATVQDFFHRLIRNACRHEKNVVEIFKNKRPLDATTPN
ncbi:MAG: hypothetical protein HYU36_11155 [Planctomycetes bacterium]|nr:hypothetical protein [Planctomycetota bacterium]